jgi:hypothetical protein
MKLDKMATNVAMARGSVVLDENIFELEPALKSVNIRVIEAPSGTSDDKIIHDYLSNRIFITRNSQDFVEFASSYDIGIIALDRLTFIDKSTINNKTVKLISNVIRTEELWSVRHGYIIYLQDDGKHEFKLITD